MPCNCRRPQEDYPENKEWGPLLWAVLHGLAEKAGKAMPLFQQEEVTGWLTILKELQFIIPCPDCREHYKEYYEANPLTKDTVISSVRIWLFNLHNIVNYRKDTPPFPIENLSATYPPQNIRPNLLGLKKKMDVVILLRGVTLGHWNAWYTKAMKLKSYYLI